MWRQQMSMLPVFVWQRNIFILSGKKNQMNKRTCHIEDFPQKAYFEDIYGRLLLKSNPKYHKYLAYQPPSKHIEVSSLNRNLAAELNIEVTKICDIFRNVGKLKWKEKSQVFVDAQFIANLKKLLEVMYKLSDDQLVLAFKSIGSLEICGQAPILQQMILESFRTKCLTRADSWNIDTLSVALDLIHTCTGTSSLDGSVIYNKEHILKTLWAKINQVCLTKDELSPEAGVILLFHAGVRRSISEEIRKILFDTFHHKVPKNFSLEECAVIMMGLNRTRTYILSDDFNISMVSKLTREIHQADNKIIITYYKYLFYLFNKAHFTQCTKTYLGAIKLLDYIPEKITDIDLQSTLKVVTVYRELRYTSEELQKAFLDKMKWRLKENREDLRNKDIALISFIFGTWHMNSLECKDVLNIIQQYFSSERKQHDAGQKDIHNLTKCLHGFIMLDFYPESLIENLFTLATKYGLENIRMDTKHQILLIDESLKIDRPNYKGFRLSNSVIGKIREEDEERYEGNHASNLSNLMSTIEFILTEIFKGKQAFRISQIIPYMHQPDIEMWFDKDGPVPFTIEQTDSIRRVVLAIIPRNGVYTLIKKDKSLEVKPIGHYCMKLRHLERLGYVVIPLYGTQFNIAEDKKSFLRKLIFDKVDCLRKDMEKSTVKRK